MNGSKYAKSNIFHLFLYSQTGGENLMHGYDDQEGHHYSCEIHGPWPRGSGSRAGSIWPYLKYIKS